MSFKVSLLSKDFSKYSKCSETLSIENRGYFVSYWLFGEFRFIMLLRGVLDLISL